MKYIIIIIGLLIVTFGLEWSYQLKSYSGPWTWATHYGEGNLISCVAALPKMNRYKDEWIKVRCRPTFTRPVRDL